MRFSPPLQVLERGLGGEVSESPVIIISASFYAALSNFPTLMPFRLMYIQG